MKEIFNQLDNQSLLDRIEKLNPDAERQWGKMTAAQMLWHCQKPMEVATGKLILKGGLLGFLFGKWAKNSMINKQGFGKNSPTALEFKSIETHDFTTEKHKLIELVKAFGAKGTAMIANKKHPFFGLMRDQEWGNLMYIHLDHHLKQFGV